MKIEETEMIRASKDGDKWNTMSVKAFHNARHLKEEEEEPCVRKIRNRSGTCIGPKLKKDWSASGVHFSLQ